MRTVINSLPGSEAKTAEPKIDDRSCFQPRLASCYLRRVNATRRPIGILLLVLFFAAGAVICIVVMLALAFPGSFLENIWRLRPEVRDEFIEHGMWAIAVMAALGAACGLSAFGLARGAEWGRRIAIGVLTVNLVGDMFNAAFRGDMRTLIGLPIGGLMLWYLVRSKDAFRTDASSSTDS